tara:strand:- start:60 stop:194 length:135 start_codon:yes stop_codon:yes gene_type:complete
MKKEKVELFCKLVSEIDISKYNQKKFIEIVNAIFNEIFKNNYEG